MEAKLDCGDNSCEFAENKTGMRTNGGCRCLKDLDFSRRMAVRRYLVALREENARLRAKLARVVEALEQILDREELDLKHTYTTCDFGDSTNADRGCLWCVARAALDTAKGGE